MCPQGYQILSHTSTHSAWSFLVPSLSSLALVALSLAEHEVVTEQEQGIEPLEPLQSLGQEWDGDCVSRVSKVSDELLKSRYPPQQLGCDP